MSHSDLEGRFTAGIRKAGDDTFAPAPDLVAKGLRRGKQLRRRRHAGIAVAAALAVGGVATTAQLLTGGAGTPASPAAGSKPTTVGEGASTPGGTLSAEKVAALVVAEVRKVEQLGADTEVTVRYSRGTEAPEGKPEAGGNPFASLVYDDGGGKASMSVSFERHDPASLKESGWTSCPGEQIKHDSCEVTKVPGGSTLVLYQGYVYPDSRPGPKQWDAILTTKDGYLVKASALNSPEEKGAENTRTDPSLDLKQLKTLALSEAWAPVLADMAVPGGGAGTDPGSSTEPPGVPGSDIAKTMGTLLRPLELEFVRSDQSDHDGKGYASVIADDGDGEVVFDVNVDREWSTGGGKGDDQYAGAETLPDGTKVLVFQGEGEKGGEGVNRWFVDVLRPDGLRVAVQLHNSSAQWKPATREDMPLTIEQLREIALSDLWTKLQAK